jgi:hypothetical protein
MSRTSKSGVVALVGSAAAPADGQTLAFLAAAFERVHLGDYRRMVADKVRHIEARLSEFDRALSSCTTHGAAEVLHEKVQVVRASVSDLRSTIDAP